MLETVLAILQNTLRSATPIILAAMGGQFTEHAGIMNIGMDGIMLMGSFFAVLASYYLASAALGVLAAILIGLLMGILFGVLVIRFRSDEFIIGVALNIFAGGVTVFLLRTIFGVAGAFADPAIKALPYVSLDFLNDVPFIGPLLNNNSILVYVSWLLVLICWIAVYKTPFGLRLRASGEHPESLRSAGVNPNKLKYISSMLCGMLCGLAGAHLALGYLTQFSEGMSSSRGFIAFACIIFGRANPPKVFLASLLFGFMDALALRLQFVGISSNLSGMMPYIMTVLMMVYVVVTDNARKSRTLKLNAG
ncbi:MAG: ABC transporter permease [Clostridia bacterium]|nr:ABC transporter permease [Clostridia bacterium]